MKAQDLRIGNIIKTPAGISVVTGISTSETGDSVRFRKVGDTEQNNVGYYLEFCEPIPLSEDWLLGFGFKKEVDDCTYYSHDDFDWYILLHKNGEVSLNWGFEPIQPRKPNIKYVHQLQNLFYVIKYEELN